MNNPRQPIPGTEKPMPMEPRKQQPERRRGQNRPKRVALLQDAGKRAAAFFGQRLKHQRRAHAPHSAHGNAEQRPQRQQRMERGRKGAASSITEKPRMFAISTGRRP